MAKVSLDIFKVREVNLQLEGLILTKQMAGDGSRQGSASSSSKPPKIKKTSLEDGGTYKYGVTASNIQGNLETLEMRRKAFEVRVELILGPSRTA